MFPCYQLESFHLLIIVILNLLNPPPTLYCGHLYEIWSKPIKSCERLKLKQEAKMDAPDSVQENLPPDQAISGKNFESMYLVR